MAFFTAFSFRLSYASITTRPNDIQILPEVNAVLGMFWGGPNINHQSFNSLYTCFIMFLFFMYVNIYIWFPKPTNISDLGPTGFPKFWGNFEHTFPPWVLLHGHRKNNWVMYHHKKTTPHQPAKWENIWKKSHGKFQLSRKTVAKRQVNRTFPCWGGEAPSKAAKFRCFKCLNISKLLQISMGCEMNVRVISTELYGWEWFESSRNLVDKISSHIWRISKTEVLKNFITKSTAAFWIFHIPPQNKNHTQQPHLC